MGKQGMTRSEYEAMMKRRIAAQEAEADEALRTVAKLEVEADWVSKDRQVMYSGIFYDVYRTEPARPGRAKECRWAAEHYRKKYEEASARVRQLRDQLRQDLITAQFDPETVGSTSETGGSEDGASDAGAGCLVILVIIALIALMARGCGT